MNEYRIVQDGMPVAGASGKSAWIEIKRYAAQYAGEGPLVIQEKRHGKWYNRVRVNLAAPD